ncbi:NAD/NADP octopine/nopaline dehydrogenase family protein [Neobacillus niacini]|uniref:NAD/NADP-dependent octopine/nopaline dehydrogenase family protein n=1 Tax=Neobacillus niacini TaxID=86668 RepID=UPI0007AC29BE|nr:NAD/NADP-dependent octopine/nopaline dehydrogenase family protein [Neobacillus niacini]MEC1523864.1 NAD/NADP octopine/nopaline dehydrogenase family protein [Neobacillus niacini]
MKFAVLGAGNTGQTFAAYLALNGEEVKLYDRNIDKVKCLLEKGIELRNKLNGKVSVYATTDMAEAVRDADIIFICTTANGHKPVFESMKPYLVNGQTIIITPGYWGAVECKNLLKGMKNIVIAETDAMMFVSQSLETGIVNVRRIKSKISLGTIPSDQAIPLVDRLRRLFPGWEPASNVWETSLNNTNVTIHPTIMLFNASRVNFADEFKFYDEGASRLTVAYIENIDKERLLIAKALGVKEVSILELLNSYYVRDFLDLQDALRTIFKTSIAPKSFEYRYITEDIPYGLVAISELGRKLGIETTYTDCMIEMASLYLSKDFRANGVSFEQEDDLKKYPVDSVIL